MTCEERNARKKGGKIKHLRGRKKKKRPRVGLPGAEEEKERGIAFSVKVLYRSNEGGPNRGEEKQERRAKKGSRGKRGKHRGTSALITPEKGKVRRVPYRIHVGEGDHQINDQPPNLLGLKERRA